MISSTPFRIAAAVIVSMAIAASGDQESGAHTGSIYLGTQKFTQEDVPQDGTDVKLLELLKEVSPAGSTIQAVEGVAINLEGRQLATLAGTVLPTPGRYSFTGRTLHGDGNAGEVTKTSFELTVVVVDVDECGRGTHTCFEAAECINTHGSFECSAAASASHPSECLHLGTQTFTQDEAPQSSEALAMLSGDILRLFEDKRGLLTVRNRAKDYEGGQIRQKPGMYTLKETIEHSPDDVGRSSTCVELTVVITDVNECLYDGLNDAFRAVCHSSTICRNLDGSYSCECPLGKVAHFNDNGAQDSCRFATDSKTCCGDHGGLVGTQDRQLYRDWL
eukprot:CAMPEP_0206291386 /NCGR_PEP_ID=MMETSP0106_2-20121207/3096_1 /ASSEMBLY_ACC=CAM_ASM_000206 /TAXON_ID=81532 /ORGANISM="Acanthoeca-like sp., Strain 10tr" /LENGTH=332 /DNA_ID=CAMNT_0053721951 /DNA_START=9 /DNA_END=1004 /DNA_ORIENTATION=-